MPSKKNEITKLKCVPDFNVTYRFTYITFATLFATVTLFYFSELPANLPKTNITREFILAVGQMVFQMVFLIKKETQTIINYLGNLMTVSLLGSIILVPIIYLNSIIKLHEIVILGWFACTVLIMFLEHARRIKILELPKYITYTWVLYRITALVIILNC